MSIQHKWSTRAYQDGDEYRIFELWNMILSPGEVNHEQWMRWWNWRYKENPVGAVIVWLAEHAGQIVGQYAVIPVRMKIGSETVLTAHSLDTMTHPDYTRQGIFTSLANKVYEDAAGRGIKIVHGFPNRTSHPVFIGRLDWFDVVPRQIWIKPFRWRNTIGLMVKNKFAAAFLALGGVLVFNRLITGTRKPPVIRDVIINQVSSFDNRINAFWDKISRQYQIISVRDMEYLNWRYIAAPDVTYSIYTAEKSGEICGYLVSRVKRWGITSLGVVFDILAESMEIAQCLISRAVVQFESDKVDTAFCRMVENEILPRALKRSGFIAVPSIKEVPLGVRLSGSGVPRDFLKDSRNWFIQVGDSDWV